VSPAPVTPAPSPVVRPAQVTDAEPLVRCHLACWQETYTGLVPQPALEKALAARGERTERWRGILRDSAGTFLAEHQDEVVGFASVGRAPEEDLAELPLLHALYVRQAQWGTGLGHRLLTTALGDQPASLWVLATNARARRFYAAHGFEPDGRERVNAVFDRLEIRMVRAG
jgi:GNAT superfamily N-acetyltransferase